MKLIINGSGFYGDPIRYWGTGNRIIHINNWKVFNIPYIRVHGGVAWCVPFLNRSIHNYPPRERWTPL